MTASSHKVPKPAPILVFFLTLLLTLSLSLPWVSAQEKEKPTPKSWEMKGIVAALTDPYAGVRLAAAEKLGEYKLDNPQTQIPNYKNVVSQLGKQLSPKDKEDKEKRAFPLEPPLMHWGR